MNKTISILVVDHHPIVRDGIKTMLEMGKFESYSFRVMDAGNILDALKLVDQRSFDLIITDSQLGNHSGAELTKSLLRLVPDQSVLGFSESDDMGIVENMLKSGAKGFIKKSVDTSELIQAITAILGGRLYYALDIANALIERRILGKTFAEFHSNNSAVARLSKREIEILKYIADQMTNEEIAKKLFLSKRTIDNHRQNILNKLGMNNTAGLVRFAVENGLLN
jgi:DNA-binding NarL/FixJ family response regulator